MNQIQFLSIDISCDLPTIFPLMVKTHTKTPTNQPTIFSWANKIMPNAMQNANTEEEGEEWSSD
jgi:hypothetical protein